MLILYLPLNQSKVLIHDLKLEVFHENIEILGTKTNKPSNTKALLKICVFFWTEISFIE